MLQSLLDRDPPEQRSRAALDDPLIGARIGNYEVSFQLGRGAYGAVYKARDVHLGRFVALKFLHDFGDDAHRDMFLSEARAIAALSKHPSIVQIYEWGTFWQRDYFALEFVGSSAGMLLQVNEEGLKQDLALRIARDAAEALDFAHRRSIVHQDVKPANILLELEERRAKLADFGLARLFDAAASGGSATPGGTPAYMAPEVARGLPGSPASDIFSLGATLYELLTGRIPYEGTAAQEVLERAARAEIVPARKRRPDLAQPVVRILNRCLDAEASNRYAGAAELCDALDAALNGGPPGGHNTDIGEDVEMEMKRAKLRAYKRGRDAKNTHAVRLSAKTYGTALECFRDGEAFERVRQYGDAARSYDEAETGFGEAERAAAAALRRAAELRQAKLATERMREAAAAVLSESFAASLYMVARQREKEAHAAGFGREALRLFSQARTMYARAADEARPLARDQLEAARAGARLARIEAVKAGAREQAPGRWAEAEALWEAAVAKGLDMRAAPNAFQAASSAFNEAAALAAGEAAPDPSHALGEKTAAGIRFVWVPPGKAVVGAPGGPVEETPPTEVCVDRGFWLSATPVTQAQWQRHVSGNPSACKQGPDYPVESVTWHDVQNFVARLNETGEGRFRLPSEAEWEYACRAGTSTRWNFGDDEKLLDDHAWHPGNAGGRTHAVGTAPGGPNAWGLYDMHGNVAEWCADAWHPTLEGLPPDGAAREADAGAERVTRGGSWCLVAGACHSAARSWHAPPDEAADFIGFRVVLEA